MEIQRIFRAGNYSNDTVKDGNMSLYVCSSPQNEQHRE